MFYTSSSTQKKFDMDYDEFGDNFYTDTDETKLREVFKAVEKMVILYIN